MIIQARIYTRIPPTKPPGTTDSATQISRTIVGSTSKYSAMPPHTPAIFLSVAESVSCLCEVLCRCWPPQEEQKLEESAISLPQCTQNMKSPPEDGHSNGVPP